MKKFINNIQCFVNIFSYVLCDLYALYDGMLRKTWRWMGNREKCIEPYQLYEERINNMLYFNNIAAMFIVVFACPISLLLTFFICSIIPFSKTICFVALEALLMLFVFFLQPNKNQEDCYFREMDKKERPHLWKWRLLMLLAVVLDIALGIFCLYLISP